VGASHRLPADDAGAVNGLRDSGIPQQLLDAAQKRLSVSRKGSTRVKHGPIRDRLREFIGEEVALVWTTDRPAKEALDNAVRRVNAAIAPPAKGPAPPQEMIYPRIIAHRCGGALAPENTLAGLRLAARLGCRGVEFDAMLAADGVPVLIHDETLERTTSGWAGGRYGLRFAAARCRRRHHPAFAVEPLPTLDQALRFAPNWVCGPTWKSSRPPGRRSRPGASSPATPPRRRRLLLSSFSMSALSSRRRRGAAIAARPAGRRRFRRLAGA
jgi:hypothetical protein